MFKRLVKILAVPAIVLGLGIPALAASAAPAPHSPAVVRPDTVKPGVIKPLATGSASPNWAGYVNSGSTGEYTSVSAHWTQPAVTCTSNTEKDSSFWVGLDGWQVTSPTIEQDGTEADCINDKPVYYGWYELWPADTVYFGGTVKPGDAMFAGVVWQSGNNYKFELSDTTENWSVSTIKPITGSKRDSAEWIVEADGIVGNNANLANFGTVPFTQAVANNTPLATLDPAKLTMISNTGVTQVKVSSITNSEDFSATYTAQ